MKAGAFMAGFLALAAGTLDAFAGETWMAPNGQVSCYSRMGRRSKGEELWIRVRRGGEPALVWASDSRIEAAWSPDSRFIAVTDHYDGAHHAVLIFGMAVDPEKQSIATELLFQTPLQPERDVSWRFLAWDLKKGLVKLGKTEGKRRTVVDAFLSGEIVEQDLYSVDPRHWVGSSENR